MTTTDLNRSGVMTGDHRSESAAPTQGPWVIGPMHKSIRPVTFVPKVLNGGFIICEMFGPDAPANARLMVVAGEMLALLHETREFIDGQIDVVDGDYGVPAPNRAMVLAQEIDAAIAKAEGGSR